ncbi:pyridoxal-phosphate dependent enzyme [Rhizobium sp. CCGE531]|uniref:threonine synthase n=1 Tax=Rhizobium sp. CCGE531 TaxID=2364271 RepID=UPI000EA98A5F|nr:pyridoxal-phosphate dependent enzyme [Rhizobium sp. CCGE531]AYG66066.1 pyridoxal-phosphate dependent enzyme [Rhizobium sp. CCGE531]
MPLKINPRVSGMQCIRCQIIHPLEDYFEGCPSCLDSGIPASVAPHFSEWPSSLDHNTVSNWLSYPTSGLGEGNTQLSSLPLLAAALGVGELYTKNEFTNPTGSHKDRMGALIAQRALDVGIRTIAVASSGNAGVSMAAYAARSGLECVVVTTPDMSPNWRRAIEAHGARIVATETSDDRWKLIARKARCGEWYPATNYTIPPVGSNPFGVDGYRAIALELYLEFQEQQPTDILVPTARGDLIWGIAKGYSDLQRAGLLRSVPRVHAIEPCPRIAHAIAGHGMVGSFPDDTNMVSIGGNTVTQQTLHALELTDGLAVAVDDGEVAADQAVLGREGLYLELSSVATLTGLRRLAKNGEIGRNARVILIATSHGYKEEARFESPLTASAAGVDDSLASF